MEGFFGTIKELCLLFILVSIGSALLDYARITSGMVPLFCLKSYDEKTNIQSYRGIFYQASRKVTVSPDEELTDSTDIKFYVMTKPVKVPSQFKHHEFTYTLNTQVSDICGSAKLYYADEETKLYTYCLDSIRLKETGKEEDKELSEYLKKDSSLMEDIVSFIPYRGLYSDNETLLFRTVDTELVNNGLTILRCHKKGINDIYVGPVDMVMQGDFCSYKIDDDEYVWKIEEDKNAKIADTNPETIYEDENYIYQLDSHKSNHIYLVIPAVRGREESRIPLMEVINRYPMDLFIERGLDVEKVPKNTNVVDTNDTGDTSKNSTKAEDKSKDSSKSSESKKSTKKDSGKK